VPRPSGYRDTKAPRCAGRHNLSDQFGVDVVVDSVSLSFWAEENMSISITAQSHLHQHPGVWLGAKLALALVAILLLSLTAAGLETRYGVAPSADSATSWVLFGE
jgi:hypothetical protein